jgi:hypothetical protein
MLVLQARPNSIAVFVPSEITTYCFYPGLQRDFMVSTHAGRWQCLVQLGFDGRACKPKHVATPATTLELSDEQAGPRAKAACSGRLHL